MKFQFLKLLIIMLFLPATCIAQNKPDLFKKDSRSHAEKEQARNERAVKNEYDRQEKEKTKEQMRDKRHDNGYSVDKNTSVSPKADEKGVGVEVKKTY